MKLRPQPRLEPHPYALLVPEATHEEFVKLRDDIRSRGVLVPVVLFEGKILDGCTRYKVAREFGIACPLTSFDGSHKEALQLVMSYNIYRRHLNQSQRAVVGGRIATELMSAEGITKSEAIESAVRISGGSESYIREAINVIEDDPRIAKKIESGKTTFGHYKSRPKQTCPECGARF